MTLRESIDTRHEALVLEGLDFAPSCHAKPCNQGNPAATHLAVMLACPCLPTPLCGDCTARLRRAIADRLIVGPADCSDCGTTCHGTIADWVRIEAL